jgi:hypothetical protein
MAVATKAIRYVPAPIGIPARELARRARASGRLPELRRWLLDTGLAVEDEGLLFVTRRGREIAATLDDFQ